MDMFEGVGRRLDKTEGQLVNIGQNSLNGRERKVLYRNNGDGTFTDVTDAAGARDTQWGWAAEFLDYDNDGRLDIYAANGFITGPNPEDV